MLLHGPEIPAKNIGLRGLSNPAALQVKQEIQFTGCEGVTPYRAGDDFLNQLTERRYVRAFPLCISHVKLVLIRPELS
jgi:hypothetical protein